MIIIPTKEKREISFTIIYQIILEVSGKNYKSNRKLAFLQIMDFTENYRRN